MGFIQRTAERFLWRMIEWRSSLENPQTPLSFPAEWLLDSFNGGRTDSGIRVSEMTALQVDCVLACVRIICNGVATLPFHVYERQIRDNRLAKRLATDHPLYDLIRQAPNEEMTSHTFRSVLMVHALLWGNAYAEIQRNNGAQPVALWPRNPARTRPVRLTREARIEGTVYPRGTLVYHTSETAGDEIADEDNTINRMAPERIVLAEDMLHIPGLSLDGRLGQSTVFLARQIIGLALATEKFGAKFFGNGAVPRGILELPGVLEPKAIENLRRSWHEAHGGENANRTAVLEQGIKYTPIGTDPEKGQFLATRKYQRVAVASIFNVPPHMIGEGESSKSAVEQTGIEFLNFTLAPWHNAWEQELKRKLFVGKDAAFFAKFDTHRLTYPTADSRSKFYVSGKQWGYLNTNDIHEQEDMNPVEDGSGDVYWMPVNMQDAANPLTAPHIGGKQNEPDRPVNPELPMGGAPQNPKSGPDPNPLHANESPRFLVPLVTRYVRTFYPVFKDATGRVLNRKEVDEMQFRRCFEPAVTSMVEALSAEFAVSEDAVVPSSEFHEQVVAYLEGMRSNLRGVTPDLNETYASKEVRRAAETFAGIVARRYNPNHHLQPRHPSGKWITGKKPFFLGRHGTTDDDVAGVWSGWDDVTLNEQGERDIAAAIDKLRGQGITRVVSSNLPRAKHSAQRVATALGVPMTTDWRLNALNLGEFSKLDEKQNAERLRLYIDNPDVAIPGGESINDYVKRSQAGLNEAFDSNESTGPVLALGHSSTIAAYLQARKGKGTNLEDAAALLSPGGVLRIDGKKIEVIVGALKQGDAA